MILFIHFCHVSPTSTLLKTRYTPLWQKVFFMMAVTIFKRTNHIVSLYKLYRNDFRNIKKTSLCYSNKLLKPNRPEKLWKTFIPKLAAVEGPAVNILIPNFKKTISLTYCLAGEGALLINKFFHSYFTCEIYLCLLLNIFYCSRSVCHYIYVKMSLIFFQSCWS